MTDFDISRIVPSTRDLFGAVNTRKRTLALLPLLAEGDVEAQIARLEATEPRAFALSGAGAASLAAARAATEPLIVLTPADSAEACQRARFFGADGVCLRADAFASLVKVVQSMRMMPLGFVHDAEGARAVRAAGARALVLAPTTPDALQAACALAAELEPAVVTVAHVDTDSAGLSLLSGCVDAAVVPVRVHEGAAYAELSSALDG